MKAKPRQTTDIKKIINQRKYLNNSYKRGIAYMKDGSIILTDKVYGGGKKTIFEKRIYSSGLIQSKISHC